MDGSNSLLPLRIIAARFISADVAIGLAELDRITVAVSRIIRRRYSLLSSAFVTTVLSTVLAMGAAFALIVNGIPSGDSVSIFGLVCFGLLTGVLLFWRLIQYGGVKAAAPQKAIYADPADPAARNLERLFALLQLESSPRAFYLTRGGERRYVDHRYFFGTLRAGHVAKDGAIRNALFGPVGLWFSRELFMDIDVEKLIELAKAKPNRAGAPKTYDYTDAIMSLIEHPAVRAIEVGKRGNQKLIRDLLEDWYRSRRQTVPGETQLALHAKLILDVIAKNRATNS